MGRRSPARRSVASLGLLLAVATLVGCGSDVTADQWTDRMCSAVLPFVRTATTPPQQAADPGTTADGISDYLGRTVSALDTTMTSLQELGPAPVDDGEAIANQLRGGLDGIRAAFSNARTQVDALRGKPAADIERGLPAALAPVARLGDTTGPLANVTRDPQLGAASRNSANCRDLGSVSRAAQGASAGPDAAPAPPAADTGQAGGN
ncbi:hypothetical protein [Pseudonocardia endophytica]|uniref:Uncharacterized protein n=1 Tax=Pseudonocardia endophytica TaxID=401976 RepID=A0A4R1I3K9_PSEEN|nr:hypothetical protein [Pseudonocardia endophytica]TCK27109.1 hypothetical protein EV378_2966 [Pseudonocardia endophytica]